GGKGVGGGGGGGEVIDVALPVGGQQVLAPLKEGEGVHAGAGGAFGQGGNVVGRGGGRSASMPPDQWPPDGDRHFGQSVVLSAKVGDSLQLRCSAQTAPAIVGPPAIA